MAIGPAPRVIYRLLAGTQSELRVLQVPAVLPPTKPLLQALGGQGSGNPAGMPCDAMWLSPPPCDMSTGNQSQLQGPCRA